MDEAGRQKLTQAIELLEWAETALHSAPLGSEAHEGFAAARQARELLKQI